MPRASAVFRLLPWYASSASAMDFFSISSSEWSLSLVDAGFPFSPKERLNAVVKGGTVADVSGRSSGTTGLV